MGLIRQIAIWIGSLAWLPRFLPQIVAIDKGIQRITRGRLTLLDIAGLPNVTLTVPGRRSGIPRTTPLLAVPHGDGWLVAGSNFGGAKAPAWVVNLRASDDAVVGLRRGGTRPVEARELAGEERAEMWQVMLRTWPNYAKYEERTSRVIPVFLLSPR